MAELDPPVALPPLSLPRFMWSVHCADFLAIGSLLFHVSGWTPIAGVRVTVFNTENEKIPLQINLHQEGHDETDDRRSFNRFLLVVISQSSVVLNTLLLNYS